MTSNVTTSPTRATASYVNTPAAGTEQLYPGRHRARWLIVGFIVAAALGGAVWYLLAQNGEEQAQLVLQGNIDVRQVNLSFKVDGRIETLAVDEGDAVKAGQMIAMLDKRYFQDDLRLMQARRDNAAANLARLEHGSRPEEMTLIGTLLTSLVVAREWERGTMEALLATPVTPGELLVGKIVPYFVLGMAAMALSVAVTVFGFGVPFRGSILALLAISADYLLVMLGLGLLISTVMKNQFAASQAALISAFLPAFELSGFIFELDSMPPPIRLLTRVLPARYFVSSLQTIFLTGDVPSVLIPNGLVLLAMAVVLFFALIRATRARLE